ncbi:unnamed protein product [Arabidopsis lyrata]|uniref:uncharacterized protein LOC9309401 n=1 Tax=Arabidopsis lyrata subsp. lyrata TaxID=81972 RepID=UPI000A29D75C|nr:uncharacterized protein LOC9309401 [Arabidopsis lyrata subsp. lyrata]XP_020877015.1 uncharacterized protein LOC9309401 [Arabidopsis lyrata subsp. lyrata]XP_020877016.1 uncharacterized protein LOC9309401 [Arabidopsis lyrata subsp. lyrata]XP_020877017.1 uncharacterized protein LOC9309401 [Arabidopsis lyrata subsp. lyrata]CAH8270423.1 unnamed protein product [Arabidopsis lyrata]|eukprot:XP_020877014.1 uncharacterized protein LOC9309401 [Arabidopsis lyrata subsp. lyrata]
MPGNEFGEKIHNFFGQEGLSQDQNQSQVVDGSWSNYNNGLLGNQSQIDPSLIANLKSYNTQQSVDHERGHQSSKSQHGLNYTQQPIRSEFSRSLLQEHQQLSNGYTHGNLGLQTMPNGANFLGVNVESSRDSLSARGFTPELHKIPMSLEMGESPVNYDFFGGQQQSNTQLPGMLQPLPRQQMTFNDMQLLKQQVMVKQMHEYQMQQQLHRQQLGARQLNSLNINAVNGSRSSDNQSHMINGIPLQDASSNWLQPDLMTGNTNWMHRGISPVVQGSSSGLMITPEHGQSNLMAQQFGPSLYGMPVSGTNVAQNAFSSVQMNRLAAPHGSANSSYSLTNQPTSFLNQGGIQDSQMLPRSTYQEKALFSQASVPDSNNRPSFENFQQDDSRERNISAQEKFCQMKDSGPSEKIFMKVPENINALQKSSTLDPTEEKILFGSDDNLWDAFGSSTDMSLQGNLMSSSSDPFDTCPSLQSGSWSALMQSAVAETSSEDAVVHGWVNNNTVPHANSHTDSRAQSDSKASNALSERFHSDSTRAAVQHLPDKGNKFSDHGLLEKPMAQLSQMAGNIFHSSSIDEQNNLCSMRQNEGIEDRFGIWKAASNPNVAALIEQKNHFTQNPQRASYGFGIASAENDSSASRDVQASSQQHLDNNSVEKAIPQLKSRDGSQILESYASNNAGTNEMVNTRDFSMLPGGKDTQSGHVGSRRSISRKFQYHPMGNIDVTNESCQEKVSHLPPTLEQVSVGNQGYFGQSKFLGQSAMNMPIDRGHVSQNDLNCTNEAFNGIGSKNSPSTSASADRSVDRCNQVKSASSRQTMLELLHKVDQSPENSSETNISGIPEANTSADYGGQFRHNQSYASQGFNLQLAPPSQLAPSPDNVQFSQNSLQPLNSFHTGPEKGGTSQSRFAPWASNQSFQQSTHQGPFPGILGGSNMTSGFPYSRGYHQNQQIPVATRQSAANNSVNSSSELSTPQVKERKESSDFDQRGHSAQTPSLLNPTTHNKKGDSSEGFRMLSASQPLVASSSTQQSSSFGMMSDSPAGISAPQHRFWNQSSKPQPDILRPHPLPSNNMAASFSRQEKTNQLSSQNGDMSLSGRDMVNMHGLQSKDMGAKQTSNVASMFSKMVQSSHQSFDRSLPPSNVPKESLHHDEQMVGSGEGDTSKMTVDDSAFDPQEVAHKGEQQSPSRSDGLVRGGLNNKESANHMPHLGQPVSQSFSSKNHAASAGADHQQISPQMAPSWYSQYGTFKNGLVQPMNDTGIFTPLKIGEQSSNVESSVDGTHTVQSSKQCNMQQMSGFAPGVETPSSESLLHGATDKLLKVDKPKKRKTATSELQSWNKEVTQDSQRLKTLSEAEINWARATNRFAEKVEFETLLEDGPPIRSKRRLIHTSQLMQQLFSPPPAGVISLAASSNYEFVAYSAARGALGDACSSSCIDRSERFLPPNNSNPWLSETTKTEKISDQYISKAAEDFISRTQKLETDFAGLENGTTIPDLRVEVQDLEKFAVINRFAKFHPPSSSMDRTVNSLRLNSQRYVTVAPMPQNIPDRVQCLSL